MQGTEPFDPSEKSMDKTACTLRCGWIGRLDPLVRMLGVVVLLALSAVSAWSADESHLNPANLPDGCGSCHRGHGVKGTSMLVANRMDLCFKCHGALTRGRPGESRKNVQTVFNKRSKHPVETTGHIHRLNETLPERKASRDRHVACEDCHDVHRLSPTNPFGRVTGYTPSRVTTRRATQEYVVCYKCHSDSFNLPSGSRNIMALFDTNNLSYHPVERAGRNADVPSLIGNLTAASLIRCTSCHGNDDPTGPKGPHGSNFDSLLQFNYYRQDGPESPYAYELCYRCHDRGSILGDKSFKAHSRHVVYEATSCATCHDAHGSPMNRHLIQFNESVVQRDRMGRISYFPALSGRPKCYLKCHNTEHDDAFYSSRGW